MPTYIVHGLLLCLIITLMFGSSSQAQEEFDFNETDEQTGVGIPLSGRISFEAARQLNQPDRWVLLGPSLDLIFDYNSGLGQLYFEGSGRLNLSYGIEGDSARTRDEYQFEPILRELYWKKNFGKLTYSAGKQINDFTVMDLLQAVDKTSVINRKEYFFADPEDVKLGQNMITLEYYSDSQLSIKFVFIPYPLFDIVSDFDHPYASVRDQILLDKDQWQQTEFSLILSKSLTKGGFSLYAGRFNNRSPIIDVIKPAGGSGNDKWFKEHAPYWSIGAAATHAMEPFLLKAELAYNIGIPLQAQNGGIPSGFIETNQAELAIGTDINLGDWGFVTIEFKTDYPLQKDEQLAINRTVYTGAISWSDEYLNDRLKINIINSFPESINNMVNRFQIEYFFTNNFSISAKYVRFLINEQKDTYGFMQDYDRIGISFNYDFNLE